MAVIIKTAHSAKELSDVYKLRYQVYNQEEGYFPANESGHIIDLYDAVPNSFSVIAYNDDMPVGTIRGTMDSELGFSSDKTFDFSEYRSRIEAEAAEKGLVKPKFVNAGMLAITQDWRNRRDVFRGLFRMATDVAYSRGVTHIVGTINENTIGIYKKLGWEVLGDTIWIEDIGESVYPVATSIEVMHSWAFDALEDQETLLEHFSGCFEWKIIDKGNAVFTQGETGEEAYLITKGVVDISCQYSETAPALSLAKLSEGDMFGELSLIDETPRSATATALTNTELLVISRDAFWMKVEENPRFMKDLMGILSARLRSADHRAILYAHATQEDRLNYFSEYLVIKSTPDRKNPQKRISKISLNDFAAMSLVSTSDAQSYLENTSNEFSFSIDNQRINILAKAAE